MQAGNRRQRISNGEEVEPLQINIPSASWFNYTARAYRESSIPAEAPNRQQLIEPPTYVFKGYISFGSHPSLMAGVKIKFNNPIYIRDAIFEDNFQIHYVESDHGLAFYNCVFKKGLNIVNSNIKTITFSHCNFYSNNKEEHSLRISDSDIQQVSIDSIKTYALCDIIQMNGNQINSLAIRNSYFFSLSIINSIKDLINIENICSKKVYLNSLSKSITVRNEAEKKPMIRTLTANVQDSDQNTEYRIEGLKTSELHISGYNRKNKITIQDLQTNGLVFKSFTNDSYFKIIDVEVNGQNNIESIYDSVNFGKSEFHNVVFNRFAKLKIFYSNLADIIFTNTTFPDHIVGRSESDYLGKKEAFRQLKFAASKQGNRFMELDFESKEMEAYQHVLKKENKWDYRILLSNSFSNDHGRSYILPLKRMFQIGLPIFIIIKLVLGYRVFEPSLIFKDFGIFLEFMVNPLHKTNELFEVTNNPLIDGIVRIYDIVWKILSGYFLFQFLRAFRKFVK